MSREDLDRLEERTKAFAISVITLRARLETIPGLREVAWQLNAAAGSVAANHRAMRRARSMREFSAKLQIVNEEVDESVLWLEIAQAFVSTGDEACLDLLKEAREPRAIFARARLTTRQRQQ